MTNEPSDEDLLGIAEDYFNNEYAIKGTQIVSSEVDSRNDDDTEYTVIINATYNKQPRTFYLHGRIMRKICGT